MAEVVAVEPEFTSHEFTKEESFTQKFQFDIPLKKFIVEYKSVTGYSKTFAGLAVGDNEVVFDVIVSIANGLLDVKLLRRSQRLTDVTVTNCSAVVINNIQNNSDLFKMLDFVPNTLLAGNDDSSFSTINLRCLWEDSKSFVNEVVRGYSYKENSVLKICGLIIYNNPLPSTIKRELEKLMIDGGDIEILVGDTIFPGHKWLLSARCDFFRKMFQTNMIESCENKVELKEDPKVFEQVLRFLYTDSCPDISSNVTNILLSADKYNIEGLRVLCEEEMMKTLNTNNVCDYLVKSKAANSPRIYEKCMDFFLKNVSDVIKTESWEQMKVMESAEKFMADIFERMGTKNV